MAKDKQSDDDLLAQMEAEESVTQLAKRLEALEAQATIQPQASERMFKSPAGKGDKTFRVIVTSAGAPFKSAIVTDCCDESEAVRTALAEYKLTETHAIRYSVQSV